MKKDTLTVTDNRTGMTYEIAIKNKTITTGKLTRIDAAA